MQSTPQSERKTARNNELAKIEPVFIRADEVAKALSCAKTTVYGMAKSGKIPSIVLGKQGVRFDLQDVMTALKRTTK
jgi:excisionase family DNA binding protein